MVTFISLFFTLNNVTIKYNFRTQSELDSCNLMLFNNSLSNNNNAAQPVKLNIKREIHDVAGKLIKKFYVLK